MKPVLSAAIFLVLGGAVARGAKSGMKERIKEQAESINAAMIAGDAGKIVDRTYPALVEKMGGRKKMIATIEAGNKEMKAAGFTFLSAKNEEPTDPVQSKGELFVIVPYVMSIRGPGMTMHQKTCLIGISRDNGKTWTFLSGDGNSKLLHELLPNFPAALKIPPNSERVIERNPPATKPSKG